MAATPAIPNFPADAVRAGLRLAMTVGLPVITEEQPTFYFPSTEVLTGDPGDQEGVPFAPTTTVVRTPTAASVQVPCAIEYQDGAGKVISIGVIQPAKVVLTFLDEDYEQVKGFQFVVIGASRFFYRRTEPPKGLVTVGLYKIHCFSEDEG